MADRLKELLNKVLEWWNKFTAKQKTVIIAAAAGVALLIVVIVTALNQPKWELLVNCKTTKEAAEIIELLEGADIEKDVTDDGLRIRVKKEQLSDANLLLGANDIQSASYSIDNVSNGGFSMTEADKQKRYQVYLEKRLEDEVIGVFSSVKNAVVSLHLPENNGTLISQKEEASATVILELKGEFSADTAAYLAKAVANAIGNETEEKVVVMDTEGNMLFSGDDSYSMAGTASSQLGVKSQAEKLVKDEVRQVLLGTSEFDKIEVASNLSLSFASKKVTDHRYYVEEGLTQGYLAHEDILNSESVNEAGNVPGTDPNDEATDYQLEDGGGSSSTVTEESRDFLPSEIITNEDIPPGAIDYSQSTVAVTATSFNLVREEEAKSRGDLDGTTWEEYKANAAKREAITVSEDLYEIVSKATGVPRENIHIVAYSENMYFDKEGFSVSASDIIQVVLIILILGLLAFVVLRSMRTGKEVEQEEELSVENLLQSQPVEELENIDLDGGSETKRIIEKFVEDNPEVAANLLRNWLTEDWG